MSKENYLMESEDEILRLELKTDIKFVEEQALWAGLKPGMRVLDIGCGTGKTTSVLHKIVTSSGEVVGVDDSHKRLDYAKTNYEKKGVKFTCCNILKLDESLGKFDFIWVRFILEYFFGGFSRMRLMLKQPRI